MPENSAEIKARPQLPAYETLLSSLQAGLETVRQKLGGKVTHLDCLAFLLQHEGHPLSLNKFFMFQDLFAAMPPKRMVFMTGRQTAKSTSAVAANSIERIVRPNTKSLIVTPLFQQVHRLSTEVAAPMVAKGLFHDEILENTAQQVLKRKYANGSVDHYSYAFMTANRIRGISGIDRIWMDEVQDIRDEFIPIIEQTSAGRPLTAWKWYTGTPLSMSNTIQKLWEESSQGVETVKCGHCGHWNIACVEHDLLAMIGPETCVCSKCQKPLDVMKKVFIMRHPDREELFPGRHISQVLHPFHALIPSQWRELRRNQEKYTTAQFHNEVLGSSFDSADRMIDLDSLRNACTLGPNTLEEALRLRNTLDVAGVAVDWTGGGDGHSFTKMVFGGIPRNSSELRVLYMVCMPKSMPIQAQIPEVLRLAERFHPDLFAHDYSGHGWLFEALGLSLDLDQRLIWPFEYGMSPNREVIYSNPAKSGLRSSYHLDHTRSLFALYTMIKAGRVKFPDWMQQCSHDSHERPVDDFMHMYAETHPGLRSGEILYVRRDSGHSDDYVHATNFLASACWYAKGSYPAVNETSLTGARLVPTEEEAAEMDGGWMLPELGDSPLTA